MITLNATVASQAGNDFLFAVTGLTYPGTSTAYLRFLPRDREVRFDEPRKDPKCTECGSPSRSRLARGDAVPLPTKPGFRRRFDGLSDEAKLRRVPRGFPPDHPAAEWLKLQSFTARVFIEPSVVTSSRLVDRLCRDFELLVPLVRWLNRALGYQPAKARSSAPPVPARRGRGSGRRSRRA